MRRAMVLGAVGVLLAAVAQPAFAGAQPGCTMPLYEVGPNAGPNDFDDWTIDTFSFASLQYDGNHQGLRLRGGYFAGTSSASYLATDSNTCQHSSLVVDVSLLARDLEGSDKCYVQVTVDGGSTWSDNIVKLKNGQDGPSTTPTQGSLTVPINPSSAVDFAVRLSLKATDHWDYCYLESVSIRPEPDSTTSTSTSSTTSTSTSTTTTTAEPFDRSEEHTSELQSHV